MVRFGHKIFIKILILGSSHKYTDFQLRPNFAITLKLVPDIIPLEKAMKALEVAGKILNAPLGICTLDPGCV